jgi:hypothetical protein
MRTYTVEEANAALPQVRGLVQRIVELSAQLPELEDELRIAVYREARSGAKQGEEAAAGRARLALEAAKTELAAVVADLELLTVQLKDARTGLVDFLAYRDGELVELCWKLGEDSVGHWHRLGDGFPGRRPLSS